MARTFSIVPLEEINPKDFIEVISLSIEMLSWSVDTNFLKDQVKIKKAEEKLAKWKVKFFRGGQSAKFALKFELPQYSEPLIIKTYTKYKPIQLACHIITTSLFNKEFSSGIIAKNRKFFVKPAKNILLSQSEYLNASFLVQNFSLGQKIDLLKIPISSVAKKIAEKKYIIDPWMNNWRMISLKEATESQDETVHLEYIDTLLSNNVYQSSEELINKIMTNSKDFKYYSKIL